jgi:hypothetical protein
MKEHDKYSWNWKRIAGTGIAAVGLASLFCSFGGASEQGCNVRYETIWVAVEVVRHVILACWQLVLTYLCKDSRCCQHLFQIVTSIWPLFCVIAG